jgi:hypothetical protein
LQQSVAVLSQGLQQSAAFSHSDFLSQSAHFVWSQHFCSHSVFVSQQVFCSQHSVFCSQQESFFELLLQQHEAVTSIAATMAIDIKTFFIVSKFKCFRYEFSEYSPQRKTESYQWSLSRYA